jgi:L-fuconolactonase
VRYAYLDHEVNIDAHQHFWRYSPHTHGWIDDSMSALERDFLPRDLEPRLYASGFDGSIAVQAVCDTAETEWLLDLADEHDWIRGVVGWVDLCAENVHAELERLSRRRKLAGIRHDVQNERDPAFMLRPDFQRGIALLAPLGLVYDFLIRPHQFAAAIELAARFPEQRFVLDHLGKPEIQKHQRDTWAASLRALAAHDNVSCKLSGLVTEADWRHWTLSEFDFFVETALGAFGPERLMVGSDWPVCLLAAEYARAVEVATSRLLRIAPDLREGLMGANATRAYSLDSRSPARERGGA